VKQVWRILVAVLAIGALAAGGTVAYGQRGGANAQGQGQAKRAAARTFTFEPAPKANPEGIVFDKRRQRFLVSDTGDGKIYSGTLGSTTMTPFIPAAGAAAVGLEIRGNKLYVAGGPSGEIRVYDVRTKQQVAKFDTGSGGFLNDVAVTSSGDVFVTDSFRPTLWHVTPAQVRAGSGEPQALDVSGGIPFDTTAGVFNLNGIVARTAHSLVVVDSNTGRLFRIDLNRRLDAIRRIARIRGAAVPTGDGMILDRGRLVVVQGGNADKNVPTQISFVKLRRGASRAQLQGTQRSRRLVGPSTITRARNLYLVVNANFSAPNVAPNVVALPRKRGARGR
jgi:Cu-Zn family superoxide dismutase